MIINGIKYPVQDNSLQEESSRYSYGYTSISNTSNYHQNPEILERYLCDTIQEGIKSIERLEKNKHLY